MPIDDATASLLERADQLDTLDSFALMAAEGRGSLTVIEASAGLGKTSLLDGSAARIGRGSVRVLRARGSELERAFPYGIVRQLLEHLFVDEERRTRVLTGAAAIASRLLAAQKDATDTASEVSPFPMLHALFWTVSNLCDESPLALLIDDAHDADLASLRFVSYLAARSADLPLMVVLAVRPPWEASPNSALDELRRTRSHRLLEVAPLSGAAVNDLIAARLGQLPEPEFSKGVLAATGGNPFYLGELLRDVAGQDLAPIAANEPLVRQLGPAVIVRMLLFRLASLPDGSLPLVRACAILGDGALLGDCAELGDLADRASAARAADALIRASVLQPGPRLAFAHPILHAAVLADLGINERTRLHAIAATLLANRGADPQLVGLHILRADPEGNADWVEILRQAARFAAHAGTPVAAAEYLRRAVAEPPSPQVEADVLYELGEVEAAVGDPTGIGHLRTSVASTSDVVLRAHRSILLADYQMRSGLFVDGVRTLDSALTQLGDRNSDLALTLTIERYWTAHLHLDTAGGTRGQATELRRLLDSRDSATQRRLAAYLALDAAREESREVAFTLLDRALARPGLLEYLPPESTAVGMALLALSVVERYDDFDMLADQALAETGKRGPHLGFPILSTVRALECLRRGQLLDAETELQESIRGSTMQGWQHGAPGVTALLASSLLDQGRVDEAASVLNAYPGDCADPPDYPSALLLDLRGRLRTVQGEFASGLADLLRCGARMDELGLLSPGMLAWRSHAALAQLALGRREAARELAEHELSLANQMGGPISIGIATRALALATGGDTAIRLLRESTGILDATPARLERARARVELGAALRRAGHPTEAREHLNIGRELATDCHADALAADALQELIASGGRPRRHAQLGPDPLTASEARVARLAARGLTNTEIAQSLFLSRKTIEKHLANVYRKLKISSRRELDIGSLPNLRANEPLD